MRVLAKCGSVRLSLARSFIRLLSLLCLSLSFVIRVRAISSFFPVVLLNVLVGNFHAISSKCLGAERCWSTVLSSSSPSSGLRVSVSPAAHLYTFINYESARLSARAKCHRADVKYYIQVAYVYICVCKYTQGRQYTCPRYKYVYGASCEEVTRPQLAHSSGHSSRKCANVEPNCLCLWIISCGIVSMYI